ncbi:aldo/keto reductase [Flavobacteriales bacterium]|jgi:aryl-alcohol dehydrogenase-like predicted oxidoreductase|nr:aldo/keto reductase [Flavobacteriales bacterium]MDA9894113.1 aldo/keto reductase [bacterium]
MKYNVLPNTDIKVSKICLGTMTYGRQNSEDDGHQQLDYALEKGVNFIDTAEMYPVPAEATRYGNTESIIGSWIKKSGKRNDIVLATKIAGPGDYTKHIRTTGFSENALNEAVENSLKRLQTDFIDLYQLHWPDRNTNKFGVRGFKPMTNEKWEDNFKEVLHSLDKIIKSGKIRHIGLSNENPWGMMRFLEESKNDLPRMITIQNPYSLLNRQFEVGNAEVSIRENVGLLAYSPLGCGVLSGKYIQKKDEENSRLNLFKRFVRYSSNQSTEATKMYLEIAQKNGISLTKMALAFINQQPFVTSNIIGATNLSQLQENIDSVEIELNTDVLKEIDSVHETIPDPAT